MRMTSQTPRPSGPEHAFIEAVRRAAKTGQAEPAGRVWDDYDRLEVHRWANRIIALTFLVGVRANVVVRFRLPVARLPDGGWLEIDTQWGCGCRLYGPWIDRLLAGLVLPQVFHRHRFHTVRGWEDLTRTYRAGRFRYWPEPDGLQVTFIAEMEAYR